MDIKSNNIKWTCCMSVSGRNFPLKLAFQQISSMVVGANVKEYLLRLSWNPKCKALTCLLNGPVASGTGINNPANFCRATHLIDRSQLCAVGMSQDSLEGPVSCPHGTPPRHDVTCCVVTSRMNISLTRRCLREAA